MKKNSNPFAPGHRKERPATILRTFLLTWLPLAVLIGAMLMFVYHTETKSSQIITERTEANEVSTLKEVIAADLHSAVSDLMILAGHHGLKSLLDGDMRFKSVLTSDYLGFSKYKGLYDQIRYLDESGLEVVRVNYNKGIPFVVPGVQLQNKGKRYYFKDAFVLEKGQVFVSPFDLNIERGAIEKPLKPMIRLGTPVFDSAGNKRGIVLINYLGAKLIRSIQKAYQGSSSIMLLNADGYFLKGAKTEEEWGFMYDDGAKRTLAGRFPDVWEKLKKSDEGSLITRDGLFTYARIYPVTEADRTSSGARLAYSPSRYAMDSSEYYWTLVSRITPGQMMAESQGVARQLGQLYFALLVLSALGAWLFASARQTSVEARLARERMADRLAASNRDLEEFAHIASHDLQEPLRKVIAFGDRLKAKYSDVLEERGRDYIERMSSATRRMQTLINDLLTYSRVSTKRQPFVPVNLAKITREVLSDLETRIAEVNARVEIGELPQLEADPLQMRQLMQNLIANALKFHKPNEPPVVTISSRILEAPDIAPASFNRQASAEIVVQDNGIGFPPRHADRIFGTFQRLHGRSRYEGTGIGLSVCRKIIERHAGTIKADGKPDKGARFIITLPLKQQKENFNAAA